MKSLLKIKNIKKTLPNSMKALKGISFELFEGEVFGLLGVNGAGKTTLSSIIASLNPPTSGDVIFKGESIYKDLINYRKQIGFCPQKQNLGSTLTVEEILMFSGRYYGLDKKTIKEHMDELIGWLKLDKYRKFTADKLSGGYKQRVLIARSLMHKPSLLILDEPTAAMDPQIRQTIWKIIRDLKKKKITVILTTHYLDEAEKLSDRVCFMEEGNIITIETPENLKAALGKVNLEEVFLQLMKSKEE